MQRNDESEPLASPPATKDGPLVSVVIAAYNEQDAIHESINSVLDQSYSNLEVIVVDDGSNDDTADTVSSMDDSRIELLQHDENRGLPAALNTGIQHARGTFIARLDADEHALPGRIAKQAAALERDQSTHVVGCWFTVIGRDHEPITTITISPERTFSVDELLERGAGVAHGSVMFRRESVLSLGGYREEFARAQDYDLWLRMAQEYGPGFMQVVPESLYERRISADQIESRPIQRVYVEFAREAARARRRGAQPDFTVLQERVAEVEPLELSDSQRDAMYHYLAGVYLLRDGDRWKARRQFFRSIRHSPGSVRPWYKLCLSIVPTGIASRIKQTVQSQQSPDYSLD